MSNYTLYHETLTACIQEVERMLCRTGLEMDPEHGGDVIGFGPAKPVEGNTNRYTVRILKDGAAQRRHVHIQVYNRGTTTNTFELNCYVS